MRVADKLKRAARKPFGKINQRVWYILRIPGSRSSAVLREPLKRDLPAEGQVVQPVELGIADVCT